MVVAEDLVAIPNSFILPAETEGFTKVKQPVKGAWGPTNENPPSRQKVNNETTHRGARAEMYF